MTPDECAEFDALVRDYDLLLGATRTFAACYAQLVAALTGLESDHDEAVGALERLHALIQGLAAS